MNLKMMHTAIHFLAIKMNDFFSIGSTISYFWVFGKICNYLATTARYCDMVLSIFLNDVLRRTMRWLFAMTGEWCDKKARNFELPHYLCERIVVI